MATVILTLEAVEQLEALPLVIHARVRNLLKRLEDWPEVSGAKPLRGALVGAYRIRTGDYRLQFRVSGDKVTVEKIGHRDQFYRQ